MDFADPLPFGPQLHVALRRLLSDAAAADEAGGAAEDPEEQATRMHNNFLRTLEFLWVFAVFSVGYCSLSFYMYKRPYDSAHGASLASKVRRMPLLRWFFRQPSTAAQAQIGADKEEPKTREEKEGLLSGESSPESDGRQDHDQDVELGQGDAPDEEDPSGKVKGRGQMLPMSIETPRSRGTTPRATAASAASSSSALPSTATSSATLVMGSENATLAVCAVLLLLAYLTWGFMQETIMGHPYGDASVEENWFHSSEWCVLINRAFGFTVASIALRFTGRSGRDCPPFYLSLCALSNMMSSWLQYESLHYVTFPVQTIFKSSKVLITMGVGKAMGKSFDTKKYLSACCIAVGVYVFLSAQRQEKEGSGGSSDEDLGWYFYVGLVMIAGYAFSDAFTSNWQSVVFAQTKIAALEMQQGVNLFTLVVSCVFCLPQLGYIYHFYVTHPLIILHSLIMGLCAGFGQVVIFFTIQNFGPMKFATVMTTRMMLAVINSIVYYGHHITPMGWLGMVITFASLFYQAFTKGGSKGKK